MKKILLTMALTCTANLAHALPMGGLFRHGRLEIDFVDRPSCHIQTAPCLSCIAAPCLGTLHLPGPRSVPIGACFPQRSVRVFPRSSPTLFRPIV